MCAECWKKVFASVLPRCLARALLSGLIGLATLIAGPAKAQSWQVRDGEPQIEFHIPAGPLETAIASFSRQTSLSVLYDNAILQGRPAPAVDGMFSRKSALETLLKGTGVAVRYADAKSFVLVADEAQTALCNCVWDGPPLVLGTLHVAAPRDYSLYSSLLASDLQSMLRKKAGVRTLNLLVRADIWVDQLGHVEHAELRYSTGSKAHDEDLVQTLNEFAVSRPPPDDMPQPVLVSINIQQL